MRRAPVGPADSAAASTKGFVERRLYSRNVNYAAIDGLFQTKTDEDDDSRAGTPMHELESKPDRADEGEPDESKYSQAYSARLIGRCLLMLSFPRWGEGRASWRRQGRWR